MQAAGSIAALLIATIVAVPGFARDADDDASPTPSGFTITPLAAKGAVLTSLGTLDGKPGSVRVTNPAALAASPDGSLVALLTSGFNGTALPDGKPDMAHSTERLMIFRPEPKGAEKLAEVPLPATFAGLAWSPDGKRIVYRVWGGQTSRLRATGESSD